MQTQRKPLYFSVFAFLCISFSAFAQKDGSVAGGAVAASPRLSAAVCEMEAWSAGEKAERDSLMLSKAAFLEEAGLHEDAYQTVSRISAFGMTAEARQELLRMKLIYAWSASKMDDFLALLPEFEGPLPMPEGRVPRKSEDAAMLLSILPGVGNAYAGDWKSAGKYLLLNSSIIALGAGAFASGLYVSAFLGGGMLLYTTLPASTEKAVRAVRERNASALKSYYAPVYEALSSRHWLLADAEGFDSLGGWVTDQQSAGTVGSSYLLAHGAGKRVADAKTVLNLPHPGGWHVYVRTHNWTDEWFEGEGPGAFCVAVDGKDLGTICGTRGKGWHWQEAGYFETTGGSITLALQDRSGFDGRCDAVFLSDFPVDCSGIPNDPVSLDSLRRKQDPSYGTPVNGGEYDLVVAGAGLAGISTAVSAARLGLKVALVHDRPVLGGNNSTEIRVRMGGGICQEPYPNIGKLLLEYAHDKTPSAAAPENYQEWKKERIIAAEKNITLFRNYSVQKAVMKGSRITGVIARELNSGKTLSLKAALFADCTGDGNLGVLAGADYSVGREARREYGEESAPEEPDNNVFGASVQWQTVLRDTIVPFPEFNYGMEFSEKSVYRDTEGRWSWETGWDRDMVKDVERIRDLELLGIYSNWSYLKNHSSSAAEFANRDLDWVAFLLGKRESRRLLGDLVFSENDIASSLSFEDAAVTVTWPIDLHFAQSKNEKFFPGMAFRASSRHKKVPAFALPYRCFYSRNIDNLFMAGRNISVTHVVLGATRVMRTNSMIGEVVGMAASVCISHKCSPRQVYERHLDELKALMRQGVGDTALPNTQVFHTH